MQWLTFINDHDVANPTAESRFSNVRVYEANGETGGAGQVVYLHTDHLGAVVKATDGEQNLVWDAVRKPFGEREVVTGQVEVLLGFPGQYYDEETNNYYNYFRDYDPSTGRYLQSDPIGLRGGINTYAYVGGNPLVHTDPLGLAYGCPTGMAPDSNGVCHNTDFHDEPCISANCAVNYDEWNTPGSNCRMECNVKYQPVCTAAGVGTGYFTTPVGGAVVGGGCVIVKAVICNEVCDDDCK
jgi:RHS repeat-associated protein